MTSLQKTRGFTLLELMIVVAIIVILAAIAIPAYTGYVETGRVHECQQEMASLALAQEEFFLEQRTYFEGLTTAAIQAASGNLWKPAEPLAANRNCEYSIVPGGTGIATSYSMTATGSNKLVALGVLVTKTK